LNLIDSVSWGGALTARAISSDLHSLVTVNVLRSTLGSSDLYDGDDWSLGVFAKGRNARAVLQVRESMIRGGFGRGVYVSTREDFDDPSVHVNVDGHVELLIQNSFIADKSWNGLEIVGNVHATVLYSTITGNGFGTVSPNFSSGISMDAPGRSMEVTNTIVWGNAGRDIAVSAGVLRMSHVNLGNVDAADVIYDGPVFNVDPQFDRPGTDTLFGNYHLKATSPLINLGLCDSREGYDFDGEERPMGRGCEIGADETRAELGVFSTPFTPTPLLPTKFSQPTGR